MKKMKAKGDKKKMLCSTIFIGLYPPTPNPPQNHPGACIHKGLSAVPLCFAPPSTLPGSRHTHARTHALTPQVHKTLPHGCPPRRSRLLRKKIDPPRLRRLGRLGKKMDDLDDLEKKTMQIFGGRTDGRPRRRRRRS